LYSWLNYYEWVTGVDGPRPPQEVVEDNEALDNFVDKWKRDIQKSSGSSEKKSFNLE